MLAPTSGPTTRRPRATRRRCQGPGGSPHGTHVAGTVACNAGDRSPPSRASRSTISGVAPRAFLMNYRVFYPSESPEDFQNGNAYMAELVQAIEDAVADGADVISNSWGSSYQNTLAWPDPMVQAAEAAVDAGVVMVFAQGNSGPADGHRQLAGQLAEGDRRRRRHQEHDDRARLRRRDGAGSRCQPTLTGLAVGPAQFGPQVTTTLGPAPYVPAAVASEAAQRSLGCAARSPPARSTGADRAHRARYVRVQHQGLQRPERGGAIGGADLQLGRQRRQPPGDGRRRRRPRGDDPVVVHAPHATAWTWWRSHTANPGLTLAPSSRSRRRSPPTSATSWPASARAARRRTRRSSPTSSRRASTSCRPGTRSVPYPAPFTGFGLAVGHEHGHAARRRRRRAAARPAPGLDAGATSSRR